MLLKRVLAVFTATALLASLSIAVPAAPAVAASTATAGQAGVMAYPGCADRSLFDQSFAFPYWEPGYGSWTASLTECDTDSLIDALDANTNWSGLCALIASMIGKMPIPESMVDEVVQYACAAAGIALKAAAWKIKASNKAKCGVSIQAEIGLQVKDGKWRLIWNAFKTSGLACPDKVKDEEGDQTGPTSDYDDFATDGFASQYDVRLLEGEWKLGDVEIRVNSTGKAWKIGSGCSVHYQFIANGRLERHNPTTCSGYDEVSWSLQNDLSTLTVAGAGDYIRTK